MTERAVSEILTAVLTGDIDFDEFKRRKTTEILDWLKENGQISEEETLTLEERTKITLTRLSTTNKDQVLEKYISLDETNISPLIRP